jgi:hypothetical protein
MIVKALKPALFLRSIFPVIKLIALLQLAGSGGA